MGMASLILEILPPFRLPSKWPNFPFRLWTIVHGGQKIELAQKGSLCADVYIQYSFQFLYSILYKL